MRPLLLIVLTSCLFGGCAAPAPAAPTTTPLPTFTPAPEPTPARSIVQAVRPQAQPIAAAASPAPASLPLSLLAGRSGADLHVALDVLFEEDAFLTGLSMQAQSAARLDEQIALNTLLDQNAATLAGIVGALKGQATAQALLQDWRADSTAVIRGSQPDLQPVAGHLATGSFSRQDASDALQRRVQSELVLADTLRGQDSAQAAQHLSQVLGASDDLAKPLSAAMAPQLPGLLPATTEGGEVDLRVHLDHALTAHILLASAAMEAAADGRTADSAAYASAGAAADMNLGALVSDGIASEVGTSLTGQLQAETSTLLAAAQQQDRSRAAADLDRVRGEIDVLLSTADPLLAPGLLNQQLRPSDQALLTGADAFANHDFASAFARVHEAVRQVQKPASTLALAIVDRYPARYLNLPTPAPQSGRLATTT